MNDRQIKGIEEYLQEGYLLFDSKKLALQARTLLYANEVDYYLAQRIYFVSRYGKKNRYNVKELVS